MGDGSSMNVEENLNRLDEVHIAAHLIHKCKLKCGIPVSMLQPARVLTPHGTLVDVFTSDPIKSRLQQISLDATDDVIIQYARCYILYLLGDVLLPDKANNTVHVLYLPLLADFDAISTYSWGSTCLCWLYRAMCLTIDYTVEGMTGCHTLLMSWIYYRLSFWAPNVMTPHTFSLATRWAGKKGHNDYAEQCLLRNHLRLDNLQFNWMPHMDPRILSRVPAEFLGHSHGDFYHLVVPLILFRWIEILNIDRVLRPPRLSLNINTFHRQLARNDDGWWLIRLSTWFEVWVSRQTEAYRLHINRANTLRPSQDYYRWYCDRTRRFLSAPEALHNPRTDDIPLGVPTEYGRAPVVRLPDIPQDRRCRRARRGIHQGVSGMGFEEGEFPEQDRLQDETEARPHDPQHQVSLHEDFYYPQPYMARDQPQPSSMQQFMLHQSSYEVGGSSQGGGTQDLIDSMDRFGWTNFSSFFDGLDHFIPQQPSPHTPTELGLALSRLKTNPQPLIARRRSASITDTAVSSLRPAYDWWLNPLHRDLKTERGLEYRLIHHLIQHDSEDPSHGTTSASSPLSSSISTSSDVSANQPTLPSGDATRLDRGGHREQFPAACPCVTKALNVGLRGLKISWNGIKSAAPTFPCCTTLLELEELLSTCWRQTHSSNE
ncbi:hypothetical protein Ahy_A08g038514 [Arachis hypogaea]|uniref:Aminotransferase-like plant mobile domain-containing protein n=1 Tax=Arachis hypogaea TaxID=3818 RepID=A0A445BTP3_ARAHY|nr:hypothetical protein Ahy_A08g038514 [Arachis hypogaea]